MGKWHLSQKVLWSLVAGLAITSIILLALFYFHSARSRQLANHHHSTVVSLQAKLAEAKQTNARLIDNFGQAQAERLQTQAQLAELTASDWQSRYLQAQLGLENLEKRNRQLEKQHELDTLQLRNTNTFLDAQTQALQREQETGNKPESEPVREKIVESKAPVKKQEPEVSPEQMADDSDEKTTVRPISPKAAASTTKTSDPAGSYRHVRLHSLGSAMLKQDSAARTKILISVIPTIPDGISGDEFAALVSGMDSKNILQVIEAAGKHISRPLDRQVISNMASAMNPEDAETATLMLLNQ